MKWGSGPIWVVWMASSALFGCTAARWTAADRIEPFRPAWWCRGPNAQTIESSLLRRVPAVALTRERWETPDGDFLDIDRIPAPYGSPLLLVLPGMEGSSDSKQVTGLLGAARRQRWAGAVLNFRSCSGEPNRLKRSYHGGETSDLRWVIGRLILEDPNRPLFCAGFSLGGNVLLKYLGEEGEKLPVQVRAAVAVSAPFDLKAAAFRLEKGFSRVYGSRLVKSLKSKTREKLKRFPGFVDPKKLQAARTLEQFDNLVTAPVHGFRDADEYWAASSSSRFLSRIRRPTLLINAKDDPFLPASCLPVEAVSGNSFLTAEFPESGGHVGFLSGFWPLCPIPWAEERAVRFLLQVLHSPGGVVVSIDEVCHQSHRPNPPIHAT